MRAKSCRVWTPAKTERDHIRNAIARASAPTRSVLQSFARWLEHARGLVLWTVVLRIQSARRFMEAACAHSRKSGAQAMRSLTATYVEDFFIRYVRGSGPAARRSMRSAMRLLLKFAASRGWVDEELAAAVPSLRRYRLAGLPRALPESDLHDLVEMTRSEACSPRNQAIVWLLVCYGVRPGQVSALRIEDIDWRARTILFQAHKRGKAILQPLLPAVAKSLVCYLRSERPTTGDDEFVFVRERRPYRRMGPRAIASSLQRCMQRAGLTPCTPQALRHSFASRMLRVGQSLKTVADLLGHRSLSAVEIYAKVDQPRLLEAAVEWPEVQP
jgi:integrase/recombinase XerD